MTVEIDGRQGEGGGQVLRSSLAFSALTGRPFTIRNIRGRRPRPGLRPQHLAAVKLAASLCGAEVEGAALDSSTLRFRPGKIRPGYHEIDVGTAGSVTLLTQAVLVPSLICGEEVEFRLVGGTDVPKSPPLDYLLEVVLPHYRVLGEIEVEVSRRGFNPAGGGCLKIKVRGGAVDRRPLLLERPAWREKHARIVVSKGLSDAKVGERVAAGLGSDINCRVDYVEASSAGAVVTLWARDGAGGTLGAGCLGRPRLPSEKLAGLALKEFEARLHHDAPVEEYLADQLVPLLALVGGRMRCQTISEHCRTNLSICGLFTEREFVVEDGLVSRKD